MLTTARKSNAGFQGSYTSLCEAVIYSDNDDPVLLQGEQQINAMGTSKEGLDSCLLSANYHSALNDAAGDFSISLKPSYASEKVLSNICDDDWLDLSFNVHGKPFHIMRGIISSVDEVDMATKSGATQKVFTISGYDFGQVFRQTKVWFNMHNQENIDGSAALKILGAREIRGNVAATVEQYLFGYLRELNGLGRANWMLPVSMPGVGKDRAFVENITYYNSDYLNDPARISLDPNWAMPTGSIWELAQEFSDPMFCELGCALWVNGAPPKGDTESTPDDTTMVVYLRDKPFIMSSSTSADNTGRDSPWFQLPEFLIPAEWIAPQIAKSRNGYERYNAYFVSTQMVQEVLKSSLDLTAPLWYPDDISLHGLRRFDISSRYIGANLNAILTLASGLRERIRDWYCLNPYYYSGSLTSKRVVPNVKPGSRILVIGRTEDRDFRAYAEAVTQSWGVFRGATTAIDFTRGFYGKEDDHLALLNDIAARYEIPKARTE